MRSGKFEASNDPWIFKLLENQLYDVRSDGSIWTRISRSGRAFPDTTLWRRIDTIKRGYRHVKYQRKTLAAHRIIYAKFNAGINYRPSLAQDLTVNHKDGNGLNNSPENLELITMGQNTLHRFRVLGHAPVIGNHTLNWTLVREIRALKKDRKLSHRELSQMYSISKGHVSEIINNRIWIEGKDYVVSKQDNS